MNQGPAPPLPHVIPPIIPPTIGEAWKFAKKSQGRMPPSMIITPEASDSANAVGDTLLSVVVDSMCKI